MEDHVRPSEDVSGLKRLALTNLRSIALAAPGGRSSTPQKSLNPMGESICKRWEQLCFLGFGINSR